VPPTALPTPPVAARPATTNPSDLPPP
jgi:hypothetical protein